MAARGLTPKQQRFVEEYLTDMNATAAARRAGYSERTADRIGPKLVGNSCVAEAIAAAVASRAERTELTQDWVVDHLRSESQLTGDGASHSARVQALKLLGLHLGMFPKKLQVSGPHGESPFPPWEDLAGMPREDLLRLYEERRRLAEGKGRE